MAARRLNERLRVDESTGPVYDDAGVDLTLVRWMLSLTPTQRLRWLESVQEVLRSVRRAGPG